ncbi:hypothetical protein [Halobaculum sp. MBLA0143]|uniref:hypothetical protein n=1 Tax=Halobaculum sp. MBLA0143 TaxID=3079933 RepID=UPI0035268000
MRVTDTLTKFASSPRATRVLLTLFVVGTLALVADPAAATECGYPPHDEPACLY